MAAGWPQKLRVGRKKRRPEKTWEIAFCPLTAVDGSGRLAFLVTACRGVTGEKALLTSLSAGPKGLVGCEKIKSAGGLVENS